jgi:hypothetical protein
MKGDVVTEDKEKKDRREKVDQETKKRKRR